MRALGRTDQIALIACLKKLNVSGAFLTQGVLSIVRRKLVLCVPFGELGRQHPKHLLALF